MIVMCPSNSKLPLPSQQAQTKYTVTHVPEVTFATTIMEVKPKQPTILEPLVGTELPFPDLFDRSERTIGATFAKFGDLKYFTPV